MRFENVTLEEAHETLRQAFWSYLQKTSTENFNQRYKVKNLKNNRLKRWFKSNFISQVLSLKQSIFPWAEILVKALFNPRAGYYKDFMTIFQMVHSSQETD